MRKVNKPKYNVKSIVCDCAKTIRDTNKKERLITASDEIQNKSDEYDSLAEKQSLSEIAPHNMVTNKVSKEDMTWLYEHKFVAQADVRAMYYDKIFVSTNGICPVCCLGQVGNLDHYLPKSLYPTYAVTPYNLIPICRDCNYTKNDRNFDKISDATLHPYYDNADDIIWLKAKLIIKDGGLVASYFVDENICTENKLLLQRCVIHFKIYKLNNRFAIEAAREISEKQRRWKTNLEKWGKEEFLNSINEEIADLEIMHKNSWKAALYRALAEDATILNLI